jgi:hypothetical protein
MVSHTHARSNGRAMLFCQSLALVEIISAENDNQGSYAAVAGALFVYASATDTVIARSEATKQSRHSGR